MVLEMTDTIKIFGSNVPKPVVYGGGALVGIGTIYFYRKQKASQAQKNAIDQAG